MNHPTVNDDTIRPDTWLNLRANNVASQSGEDGMIAAALDVLGIHAGWCVEFGAWDGRHLSNTYNLISQRRFHAVLIEGDPERAKSIQQTYPDRADVHGIAAMVGYGADDGLDSILARTPIPEDFAVLSIDIDGNDYHVWEAFRRYRPRLVVIEFNPTIPTEVDWVQPKDPRLAQGASLRALVRLAASKGYRLVGTTMFNALFVQDVDFGLFGIRDNSPERLRAETSLVTYVFCGYDGEVILAGSRRLPWHGATTYSADRVQQLPSWLRQFPPRRTEAQKVLWRVFSAARRRLARPRS